MLDRVDEKESLIVDTLVNLIPDHVEGKENRTFMSTLLIKEEHNHLVQFLKNNIDALAWRHSNMPGIDLTMASHKLNIVHTT